MNWLRMAETLTADSESESEADVIGAWRSSTARLMVAINRGHDTMLACRESVPILLGYGRLFILACLI
jgi:hypothetical protein